MKRLFYFLMCLCWPIIDAQAQSTGVPYFPQTLPSSTVVGRLSTGPGPTEAIPFSIFSSALISAITPLSTTNGGTGISSGTIGDIIYATNSSPLTWGKLSDVATGSVLCSGGVATAPAYCSSIAAFTITTLTSTTGNITTGTFTTANITTANITNLTKGVVVTAGTAALAPVTLTSGTNLTTAAAGAVEFDGVAFYATSVASSRQVVDTVQLCLLSADYVLTDTASAQKALNCTSNGQVTVAASTTYMFEATYYITNTGTNAHTWGMAIGGTATLTSGFLSITAYTANALTTLATPQMVATTAVATAAVVTGSLTSATENGVYKVTGVLRINAGGTVIPQVKQSATTGGTLTMKTNSYFRIWPIGSNTATTIGNWN